MAEPVHFYFDFISPFGFFASLRIDDIAAKHGRTAEWHSMLLGVSVMKVMGYPPLMETPLKGDYIARDAERYARLHDIPIPRPLPVPTISPIQPGRAFNWLRTRDKDLAKAVAKDMLWAFWIDQKNISEPEVIADIAEPHGVERGSFIEGMQSEEAKTLFKQAVDESLENKVFGSPFFIVDGEPFFGTEKLELLDLWLERGGW